MSSIVDAVIFPRVTALVISFLMIDPGFMVAKAAPSSPQIRSQLKTKYVDATPVAVDIPVLNVIDGRSRGPTGKTLRLQLPRNYLASFIKSGLETAVIIQLDTQTKEPWVVIAPPERIYAASEARPDLSRMLTLSLHNLLAETGIRFQSGRLKTCRGKDVGEGLTEYDAKDRTRCFRPAFPQGEKFIASYDEGLSLVIECRPGVKVSPCSVAFPFESLAVEIIFDRSRLPQWREMIAIAKQFLESKQRI